MPHLQGGFVPFPAPTGVDLVDEVRVIAVKRSWVDADQWAVTFVELFDLVRVLASFIQVEIHFIKTSRPGEEWPREAVERM